MQELLFEYAIIRIVPRVERDEFFNAGVMVYCGAKKYLGIKWDLNEALLLSISSTADIQAINGCLHSFEMVVQGGKKGGPIGQLGVAERFRWLSAVRSTIVQTSRVHTGLCSEPAAELEKIFNEQVAR